MTSLVGARLEELVVVVPGILGSRLARVDRNGVPHEVWGTGFGSLVRNLATLGRRMRRLTIPPDVDPAAPGDRVIATGVITDTAIIPGFLGISGYDGLIHRLRADNDLAGDQVVGFGYDWRLSNTVSGHALARFLDERLTRWRRSSGNEDAKAVLIAHSMGGLVSRWCIEMEGGHELVDRLFTIGTPFKGAAIALDALSNGVRLPKRIGPRFDGLVQSLPSVRELLPTYPCVRMHGRADLQTVAASAVLPRHYAQEGAQFHEQLAAAVSNRSRSRTDDLVPFRGGLQPTLSTAAVGADGLLTMHETVDGNESGRNDRGDGTVPRDSSSPPEWEPRQLALAKSVSQRHASMQVSDSVLTELATILTDAPRRMSHRAELALRAPSAVAATTPFVAEVEAPDGAALQITFAAVDDPSQSVTVPMKRADGRYRAAVQGLDPGLYLLTVDRKRGRTMPVDPVSDYLTVFAGS